MKIYLAMVIDRHADPEAYPFSTPEAAIDYARRTAYTNAWQPEDVQECRVDDWLYHADYSPEGDFVFVVEKELDEEEP